LVALLFARYTREVAKALPSDKAHPLRGSEKRTARASNSLAFGADFGFWHETVIAVQPPHVLLWMAPALQGLN
jgi:hypothetical protein